MSTIGNRNVNLFTVDRDETVYVGPTHSVSHVDTATLRRTLPSGAAKPLRTNVRFERGFAATEPGKPEQPVTVSIAVTVPPGVADADVKTYISDSLIQAATLTGDMALSGDIHLSA